MPSSNGACHDTVTVPSTFRIATGHGGTWPGTDGLDADGVLMVVVVVLVVVVVVVVGVLVVIEYTRTCPAAYAAPLFTGAPIATSEPSDDNDNEVPE